MRNDFYESSCTLGFDLLRNENQMNTLSDFFKSYTQNHQNERFKTFNASYQSSCLEELTSRDVGLNEFMAVNEKEITFESDLEFDTSCSESDDGSFEESEHENEDETDAILNYFRYKSFMNDVAAESDPDLYKGSQIKYKHFVVMFAKVCAFLQIYGRGKDVLVLF
jgi:hypothetical protein